ncbi:hypothetical protein MGN70_005149 [Eutypa lata]|nr:hypothetical protein MGN70_005149 [Eutypa lata]
MPLTRSVNSLQERPSFMDSIGRPIITSRIGRRQAWSARGPTLQKFDEEILPAVKTILQRLDLDSHTDIFILLYMIGRRAKSAKPKIIVCCTDSESRNTVERSVRNSALLDRYPGFGLESSALPLECSVPMQQISEVGDSFFSFCSTPDPYTSENSPIGLEDSPWAIHNHPGPSSLETSRILGSPVRSKGKAPVISERHFIGGKAFSVTLLPEIGRRIYNGLPSQGQPLQCATGGVVLEIGGKHYQLTVKHLCLGDKDNTSEDISYEDLAYCSLNRQSDEDDSDISDTEDEVAITSQGSLSPTSTSSADEDTTDDGSPVSDQIDQGSCQTSLGSMNKAAESTSAAVPEARDIENEHDNQHYLHDLQFPPIHTSDQNYPCNTLYAGNLPVDTSEEELKVIFSKQQGYKHLYFQMKHSSSMCFVEFEDASFATRALYELRGTLLYNDVKTSEGGIRFSHSKTPLATTFQYAGLEYAGDLLRLNGPDAILDYALVPIQDELVTKLGENLNKVPIQNPLHVSVVSDVGSEEHHVIAVTASVGPIRGLLNPSAVLYRRRGTPSY